MSYARTHSCLTSSVACLPRSSGISLPSFSKGGLYYQCPDYTSERTHSSTTLFKVYESRTSFRCAVRQLNLQRVFGPSVARVAPTQLTAHARVVSRPEAREVCRDLHGSLVRREQLQHERRATTRDARPLAHAEEVLKARSDKGCLPRLVSHARLPTARQRDSLRSHLREQPRLFRRQPPPQTFQQLASARGLTQLGETASPLAHLRERLAHLRVAERGHPCLRARARHALDAHEQNLQLL